MSAVAVTQRGTDLIVGSPYDPKFVAGVKALSGRWDPEARTWTVPLRERDRLRDLLLQIYRTDGGLPAPAAGPKAPRTLAQIVSAALREIDRIEQYLQNPVT